MAERFSVNAQAAAETSDELTRIRGSLHQLGGNNDGGVTGSGKVQQALADFVKNSSDARKKLDSELERAAGLLAGLARGATAVDQSLAEAMTIQPAGPAPLAATEHGSAP